MVEPRENEKTSGLMNSAGLVKVAIMTWVEFQRRDPQEGIHSKTLPLLIEFQIADHQQHLLEH